MGVSRVLRSVNAFFSFREELSPACNFSSSACNRNCSVSNLNCASALRCSTYPRAHDEDGDYLHNNSEIVIVVPLCGNDRNLLFLDRNLLKHFPNKNTAYVSTISVHCDDIPPSSRSPSLSCRLCISIGQEIIFKEKIQGT